MRARDLAQLLRLVYAKGHLDLERFRRIFALYDPDQVEVWVAQFVADTEADEGVSLGLLFRAFEDIGFAEPDALTSSVIVRHIRTMPGGDAKATQPKVAGLLQGLSVLAPRLIQVLPNGTVLVGATPDILRKAILEQIADPPSKRLFGMDESLNRIAPPPVSSGQTGRAG